MKCFACAVVFCLCAGHVATAGAADSQACEQRWRVRDRLSNTGVVKTPAALSLEHSAGSDTVGTADVAFLVDGACDPNVTGELQYDFGVDYHRNTSEKAPAEVANVGGNLRYYWSNSPPATPGAILNGLFLNLSAGRNIETDTQTRALALAFESVQLEGSRFWPLGMERGGITYSAQPKIEYFYGYQPKDRSGATNTTFATAALALDWVPMSFDGGPTVHVFGTWTGRKRIAGDSVLPRTADLGSVGIELGFSSSPHVGSTLAQRIGVALTYDVGKEPDSGFVHDETTRLVFTYLFDS
jgi:hypothetical protein